MDSFYVTLPSNASMKVYPKNTQTEYTTRLNEPIELEGSYEVAMAQIHYSPSISVNLGFYDVVLLDRYKMGDKAFPIILRNGTTISELVQQLQKEINIILGVAQAAYAEKAINERSNTLFTVKILEKFYYDFIEFAGPKKGEKELWVVENDTERIILCETNKKEILDRVIEIGKLAKLTTTKWLADPTKLGQMHGFVVTETDLNALRKAGVKIKLVRKYKTEKDAIFKNIKDWGLPDLIKVHAENLKYIEAFEPQFNVKETKEKISIVFKSNPSIFSIRIDGELARIINILLKQNKESNSLIIEKSIEIPVTNKSFAPVKFGYVYCDLVEPQIVGDSRVRALSVIPIRQLKSGDSEEIVTYFDNLQYVPVQAKYFTSINISIRDTLGNAILFSDPYSTTIVKLHFRRRESRKRQYELE